MAKIKIMFNLNDAREMSGCIHTIKCEHYGLTESKNMIYTRNKDGVHTYYSLSNILWFEDCDNLI